MKITCTGHLMDTGVEETVIFAERRDKPAEARRVGGHEVVGYVQLLGVDICERTY